MFKSYRGAISQIKKIIKETGLKVNKYDSFSRITPYLSSAIDNLVDMESRFRKTGVNTDSLNADALWREVAHYFVDHYVFHVTTPIATSLSNSSIHVPPANLVFPFKTFEICFQDDFKLPCGTSVPPLLCQWGWDLEYYKKISPLLNAILRNSKSFHHLEWEPASITPGATHFFGMSYSVNENVDLSDVYINFDIYESALVDDILKKSNPEIFPYDGPENRVIDLNLSSHIQRVHAKVALGLMCYYNTQKPDIEVYKDKNRPSIGVSPKSFIVGKNWDRLSPRWHLRREHIRWLVNDRFKRDGDGRIRCVWVRASEINKHKKPDDSFVEKDPSVILVKPKE